MSTTNSTWILSNYCVGGPAVDLIYATQPRTPCFCCLLTPLSYYSRHHPAKLRCSHTLTHPAKHPSLQVAFYHIHELVSLAPFPLCIPCCEHSTSLQLYVWCIGRDALVVSVLESLLHTDENVQRPLRCIAKVRPTEQGSALK